VHWRRGQASVVGQAVEWEVWVELVVRSEGRLHVFLPMLDRGVDGLVHRLDDERWIPVQVKGRSTLRNGSLVLTIPVASMVDPDAIVIGAFLDDDHLGPFVLVITEREFRRLAVRSTRLGVPVLAAQVSMVPGRRSRWSRHVFPRERMADALLAGLKPTIHIPPLPVRRQGRVARAVGFRGEVEVIRRMAAMNELTIYRPFPDLETAEVVVVHEVSRRVLGIQVKTIGVDKRHPHDMVDVDMVSFRPSATTVVVVVAWDRDEGAFCDQCLVIPSLEIGQITKVVRGHLRFAFNPHPENPGKQDAYRRPLNELGEITVEQTRKQIGRASGPRVGHQP
jgi:hypothetical protein